VQWAFPLVDEAGNRRTISEVEQGSVNLLVPRGCDKFGHDWCCGGHITDCEGDVSADVCECSCGFDAGGASGNNDALA